MKNASGNSAQTLHHEQWCDPKAHAQLIEDTHEGDPGAYVGCVGTMLVQPIEEDETEVDGWWHEHDLGDEDGRPVPEFCLDGVGEFTAPYLRALNWYLDGANTPRVIALRALIARALAELD